MSDPVIGIHKNLSIMALPLELLSIIFILSYSWHTLNGLLSDLLTMSDPDPNIRCKR